MTQEIIDMAKQAGINNSTNGLFFQCDKHDLSRFAQLVAAKEREACAKVCDDLDDDLPDDLAGWEYGEAIRARGEE